MKPTKTTYHLVTQPTQYKACYALYRAAQPGGPKIKLGFPTVYAQREGVLLGFLSSIPKQPEVVAGPLVMDPTLKVPVITAMRLCEAYEEVLRTAGVTCYLFCVDSHRAGWARTLERSGFHLFKQTPTLFCYEREMAQ